MTVRRVIPMSDAVEKLQGEIDMILRHPHDHLDYLCELWTLFYGDPDSNTEAKIVDDTDCLVYEPR